MRLDAYLVKIGSFSSRERSKSAIIDGKIKVNDKLITKVSYDVSYSDKIEISGNFDKPKGYFKLKEIQEKTNLMKEGDVVLDIGSSAGGFLIFASSIASKVHGIEFSYEFYQELKRITDKYHNITIEFSDVFTTNFEKEKYDVLLLDITTSPLSSIKALENVTTSLKKSGMLLMVIKFPDENEIENIKTKISSIGFEIKDILEPEKKEIYIIARKV